MGSRSRFEKEEMKKGAWSAEEDQLLIDYVKKYGEGQWGKASKQSGLKRCGKSVRLRWLNYLKPGIRRGNISEDEEELIIRLHKLLGNRWSLIAGRLPGRTNNEIKNYWNSTLRKKLEQENHSNEINKEKKTSNEPHLSKYTGVDGRVEFANDIVGKQDVHSYHETTLLSTVDLAELANKADVELGGDDDDDVAWTDFMMDLNEGELGITEFLQTEFSRLCELKSTTPSLPRNAEFGSCSTNDEQIRAANNGDRSTIIN